MYVQVRDREGAERFIEADALESCISAGEVVAFRRSDGWIDVKAEVRGGVSSEKKKGYKGQERRRSLLGKHAKPIFSPDGNE